MDGGKTLLAVETDLATHRGVMIVLSFWDLARPAFLSALRLEHPRGLATTRDGSRLVVNHGAGELGLVSWETRQLVASRKHVQTPFGGSHLYRVDAAI